MIRRVVFMILAVTAPALSRGDDSPIRLVEKDKTVVAVETTLPGGVWLDWLDKAPDREEKLAEILSVRVGREKDPDKPAIGGKYEIDKVVLRFTPRHAFKGGLTYRADLFVPSDRSSLRPPRRNERVFEIPAAPRGEPAKVTAIYPSAAELPDNQLRFYLHFSAPMSRGEVYEHVRLLREDGTTVEGALLEIGEELWDASGTRLTLLLDPGRVKRGLKPREIFGPILETGRKYKLVVGDKWRGADGQPLAAVFSKSFTAGPPIETAIDQSAWKIDPPRAGTREPVTVRFPQPLDRGLLNHTIAVEGRTGTQIAGQVTVDREERSWEFRPDEPWATGQHALVVDTTLEDVAGNRIGRPFEVDQFQQIDKSSAAEFVRLDFEVRPAGK